MGWCSRCVPGALWFVRVRRVVWDVGVQRKSGGEVTSARRCGGSETFGAGRMPRDMEKENAKSMWELENENRTKEGAR